MKAGSHACYSIAGYYLRTCGKTAGKTHVRGGFWQEQSPQEVQRRSKAAAAAAAAASQRQHCHAARSKLPEQQPGAILSLDEMHPIQTWHKPVNWDASV